MTSAGVMAVVVNETVGTTAVDTTVRRVATVSVSVDVNVVVSTVLVVVSVAVPVRVIWAEFSTVTAVALADVCIPRNELQNGAALLSSKI